MHPLHVFCMIPECEEEHVAEDVDTDVGLDGAGLLLDSGAWDGEQVKSEEYAYGADEQPGRRECEHESPNLVRCKAYLVPSSVPPVTQCSRSCQSVSFASAPLPLWRTSSLPASSFHATQTRTTRSTPNSSSHKMSSPPKHNSPRTILLQNTLPRALVLSLPRS